MAISPAMAIDRGFRLSRHFVLADLLVDPTFPDLALALEPGAEALENLRRLARMLDALSDRFPPGFDVMSGFRDARLNDACQRVGLPASKDSQHLWGCAADVRPRDRDLDPETIYDWMKLDGGEIGLHEAVYYPLKGFIHVAVDNPAHPTPKRILMRT